MFERFKQRSYELERLDTGDYTPEEYARWEREMPWIHSFFGEKRALENSLIKEIKESGSHSISILDVGAGSGGILKIVKQLLDGKDLFLIAAELSPEALATVRSESEKTGIKPLQCNALQLPFGDGSFDYVICTLMLHHLSDNDAVGLVSEMSRVARRKFFVVDLNRHPVGYYLYRVFSPLFLQRFTQEDGALSILRSFTPDEMLKLADDAGVADAKVEHSRANRLVLSGK